MKRMFVLPLVLVMTCLISFKPADTWKKYNCTPGHFSINFPGTPEESSQNDTTAEGVPFKVNFASFSPNDNEVYMAGWIDMATFYPKDVELKTMLENSRDGATGSMKATKVNTLATHLGENPYIEFTFATDEFIGKDRIYLINKFQYSIITIFSTKTGILPGADKFIASFKPVK